MMTTNVFFIANVKQLRTYIVLEFYCLFFRTSWCVDVLNSAILFNSFHNRIAFGTLFGGPSEFRGEGVEHLNPPPGTPLVASRATFQRKSAVLFLLSEGGPYVVENS
jgi:hypothetical protein